MKRALVILVAFVVVDGIVGCHPRHLTGQNIEGRSTMLSRQMIRNIRSGVCSIGYLTGRPKQYMADRDDFVVVGTGFLIRSTTVMTNRHVLEALRHKQNELGFSDDQKYLQFVYPVEEGHWQQAFCRFTFSGILANRELDVGLIEFNRRPEPNFSKCLPLKIGNPLSVGTGQPVGMIGYPYGTRLLEVRDEKERKVLSRFGPVLQQGYVSAIAPLDDIGAVDNYLLDMSYAGGMSGSPVFRLDDGSVVGLFYAGLGVAAFAIPLDSERIARWIEAHDRARGVK